jgi:hypothetical protein
MPNTQQKCLNCRHFRNDPQYLESIFKGMSSLSSGHASIRMDDGVCEAREQYLSADYLCDRYLPYDATGK